jgi:hypothetical protein
VQPQQFGEWILKKNRLLNKAFITLILKKGDAIHAEDFMPISLIYSFVKLKMKIVANKLNARLDSLVPKNQSDFIKGRFIQGNFMLVQQIAKYLHTQKQPRSLLRLDITKVFDSVSWTFLMEMLEKLGFGRIWRDVMSGMLTTSSTQVLLNGVPVQSITHWWRFRQGGMSSLPGQFILVMDILNLLIAKVAEMSLLQPLSSRNF